jgi:chromosome segregation protein
VNEVRSDLEARVAAEEGTAKELRKQVEDLEGRLRESASELAKVQSQLESEVSTRTRLESTRQENDSQAVREELAQIREKEAGHAAEIAEMERRVRESVVTLTRLTAELEDERTERRRVEQRSSVQTTQLEQLHADLKTHLEIQQGTQNRLNEIEEQLRTREDELAGVRADFQKELADRKLAEEQLGAVGDMSNQLRDYLGMFQESKQVFQHSQETLEKRLDACLKSISKYESKLSKEGAERKRLEEELAEAQRALREESEKNSTEMAKLKSQLQIEQLERKRLEGEGLQSRVASLDSTRSSRTMVNSLRRQIRKPVESLMQATRRLLDADLDKDQKKLAESLLESAILLQNTVQDSEN